MGILPKNPVTGKQFRRFRAHRLAYTSFRLLVALYLLSLCAELICNSHPLYVRVDDRSYFPVIRFYPEDEFLHNGKQTRPDYKKMNRMKIFSGNTSNFMLFPLIPYGPYESIDPSSLSVAETVTLVIAPVRRMATVNIGPDYTIVRSAALGYFLSDGIGPETIAKDAALKGLRLTDYFALSDELRRAITDRFENRDSPRLTFQLKRSDGIKIEASLSNFSSRRRSPSSVRLIFQEPPVQKERVLEMDVGTELNPVGRVPESWQRFPQTLRNDLLHRAGQRFERPVETYRFEFDHQPYEAAFNKTDVQFPFRPVQGHWLGIDGAGRDVLARILYGLRISLTFGLLLVVCSMALGIIAGALQGYFGGLVDIVSQRFIEIWSALPFLYIMILMGSIYGRGFILLLFCYGIFNWIGISYYIRAEFLRLRKQPFVEAAKCMGLPAHKIIFRHILPNAMIPVITFFPFSLVGAIGSLAALDYLGFGLPPPTPSWGELLFQAQQYRWAWWLILYPSLALFAVMLMGVFIGEGIRNAYDPKRFVRLK